MIIYVSGARGFVGRHVAKHLALIGHTVIGLGHGAWVSLDSELWGLKDWLNGEISHSNLDVLSKRHGLPDAVVHVAGGSAVGPSFSAPAEDFHRSVVGTVDLLEWIRLRAPKAKAVLASSAAVYGAGYQSSISEGNLCNPFSPYGFHKRMSELAFQSYACNFDLDLAVVRLFSVYGPELRKQLLWDMCSRLDAGELSLTLGGTGKEERDWINVADAAKLLVRMLDEASTDCPVVNGGTGIGTSVSLIANQVCKNWGLGARASFSGMSRSGDPEKLIANAERLNSLNIAQTIDWKIGISEYVKWFKNARRMAKL